MNDWSHSGGAWLSGFSDGDYLGAPRALVPTVRQWFERLKNNARSWSDDASGLDPVDPLFLLGERAAIDGLHRRGRRSCGGNSQIVAVRDGEIAFGHSRPFDRELLGAWLEGDTTAFAGAAAGLTSDLSDLEVERLSTALGTRTVEEIQENARALGIPLGVRGEVTDRRPDHVVWHRPAVERTAKRKCRVLDLTALWAGPLATNLIRLAGAEVIKVENPSRPDGLRLGESELFDLLNFGKQHVALDPTTLEGRKGLYRLFSEVDVVVESSRPRALEHLGIFVKELLQENHHLSWVSITAHGRDGLDRQRVGFGDDVAFAGGLHALDLQKGSTCFLADAIADPLTGVCTAGVISEVLAAEEQVFVDVAMSRVAAACSRNSGESWPAPVANPNFPCARRLSSLWPALSDLEC